MSMSMIKTKIIQREKNKKNKKKGKWRGQVKSP